MAALQCQCRAHDSTYIFSGEAAVDISRRNGRRLTLPICSLLVVLRLSRALIQTSLVAGPGCILDLDRGATICTSREEQFRSDWETYSGLTVMTGIWLGTTQLGFKKF